MKTSQRRPTDEELARRAAELLDLHADALPDADVRALARARRQALAAPGGRSQTWRWYVPAGVAAAFVLAILLSILGRAPMEPPVLDPDFQQAALEDPQLLDELEFLAWSIEAETVHAL